MLALTSLSTKCVLSNGRHDFGRENNHENHAVVAIELPGHRGRENLVHLLSGLIQDEAEVLSNSRVVAGQAVEYEDLGSISIKKKFYQRGKSDPRQDGGSHPSCSLVW